MNESIEHKEPPCLLPSMERKSEKLQKTITQSHNPSMNAPLYMRAANNKIVTRKAESKGDDNPPRNLASWLFDNQTGFSFNLLTLLFLTHTCISKARPYTSKFFTLSYYNSNTGKYAAGYDDFYFIAFCIVLLTGLRAGFMKYALIPLAKLLGISKSKDVTRFSEQGWMLIYYNLLWPIGMYNYYKSPYFLNMQELWTDWPQRELGGLMKGYILGQWAFWIQQVLVINIEDRRKDHWQMLTHHIVTITLISASYAYHQTRVGNVILVLMDVVDLFFPLAKCLKYLGFTTICDVIFGVFIISWFLSRHLFFLMICWSVYFGAARPMESACYRGTADNLQGPFPVPNDWSHLVDPFRDPAGTVCFNRNIMFTFLSYLLFLQVIMIMWFVLIFGVAMRVLKGKSAEDVRSDGEGEEEEVEHEATQPLEEEVGVEAINLKGWERRNGVKKPTNSSGVSLPGHSDHKELLNRIGCEKQID